MVWVCVGGGGCGCVWLGVSGMVGWVDGWWVSCLGAGAGCLPGSFPEKFKKLHFGWPGLKSTISKNSCVFFGDPFIRKPISDCYRAGAAPNIYIIHAYVVIICAMKYYKVYDIRLHI